MEMDMGCGPGGKVADFLPATPMAICIGGNQPLYKTADDALSDSGATSAHVMTFGEYDLYMPTGVPDVVMAMCMDGKPDSTCSASAKATGVDLPDYTGEVYPSKQIVITIDPTGNIVKQCNAIIKDLEEYYDEPNATDAGCEQFAKDVRNFYNERGEGSFAKVCKEESVDQFLMGVKTCPKLVTQMKNLCLAWGHCEECKATGKHCFQTDSNKGSC